MIKHLSACAAMLVALWTSAGSWAAPPQPSPEPSPGSPRSDLVSVVGDKFQIDHFERCETTASGPKTALAGKGLQLLIHSEAPQNRISRDRFVAQTVRAALREIEALATKGKSTEKGTGQPRLECREIEAPVGDVDFEIAIAVKGETATVSVTDVNKRNLASPTAARHSANRCIRDTMGTLYCAVSAEGTAVKTNLGQVVCGRGQCVRSSMGDWRCARAAGGWAELDPSGHPNCERGCYSPSTGQCQRMR